MRLTPLETAVVLAGAILALELLARRLQAPRLLLLAAGGLVLGVARSLWPVDPSLQLEPGLALGLVLPPLLTAAAFRVPLGAFRASLRPITLLAVGLVLASMVALAALAHWVVPGVPWGAAFVLGALLAPPDPVAATGVIERVGLPTRLTTILQGEGLVNDAVALVAYALAVEAAVSGEFTWGHALVEVARATPLGILAGLATGLGLALVRRRLDNAMLEVSLSLFAPYLAWTLAERIEGSGILAVVTLGFFLRRRALRLGSAATRLANRVVWQVVDFGMGGAVFLLLGIQLGGVLDDLALPLLLRAAVITLGAIAVRMLWMHTVPPVVRHLPGGHRPPLGRAELTLLGWAGMRGVVSLALALAIPYQTQSGAAFPARHELVVIALVVVIVTLLGQGATLAPLVRWLGLADPGARERAVREARAAALRAGRHCLARREARGQVDGAVAGRLGEELAVALHPAAAPDPGTRGAARLAALDAARHAVLEAHDAGRLGEAGLQRLETELDVLELTTRGAVGQLVEP